MSLVIEGFHPAAALLVNSENSYGGVAAVMHCGDAFCNVIF
jgi:hypothetical protein